MYALSLSLLMKALRWRCLLLVTYYLLPVTCCARGELASIGPEKPSLRLLRNSPIGRRTTKWPLCAPQRGRHLVLGCNQVVLRGQRESSSGRSGALCVGSRGAAQRFLGKLANSNSQSGEFRFSFELELETALPLTPPKKRPADKRRRSPASCCCSNLCWRCFGPVGMLSVESNHLASSAGNYSRSSG